MSPRAEVPSIKTSPHRLKGGLIGLVCGSGDRNTVLGEARLGVYSGLSGDGGDWGDVAEDRSVLGV